MKLNQTQSHVEIVDGWLEQSAKGLPSDALVRLFDDALTELQRRTLLTLSEVTLHAILDRVLYQSQQRYPLLTTLRIEKNGISLGPVKADLELKTPTEITQAFRFLIVELLTILDNLTAGILIEPLYKVLLNIKVSTTPPGRHDREDL